MSRTKCSGSGEKPEAIVPDYDTPLGDGKFGELGACVVCSRHMKLKNERVATHYKIMANAGLDAWNTSPKGKFEQKLIAALKAACVADNVTVPSDLLDNGLYPLAKWILGVVSDAAIDLDVQAPNAQRDQLVRDLEWGGNVLHHLADAMSVLDFEEEK